MRFDLASENFILSRPGIKALKGKICQETRDYVGMPFNVMETHTYYFKNANLMLADRVLKQLYGFLQDKKELTPEELRSFREVKLDVAIVNLRLHFERNLSQHALNAGAAYGFATKLQQGREDIILRTNKIFNSVFREFNAIEDLSLLGLENIDGQNLLNLRYNMAERIEELQKENPAIATFLHGLTEVAYIDSETSVSIAEIEEFIDNYPFEKGQKAEALKELISLVRKSKEADEPKATPKKEVIGHFTGNLAPQQQERPRQL